MKLVNELEDFLKSYVNLNQTRLDTAKNSIGTITDFIENEDLFWKLLIKTSTQGSFKHQTIIKPVNQDDEHNNATGWNLKKVVRLLKYLRDYNKSFDIKSILLTTLIANEVNPRIEYSDISFSFMILINSLASKLELITDLQHLDLSNPVLPEEKFDRHINQDIYSKFRESIMRLSSQINDAYSEVYKEDSIILWREIFWEHFGNSISRNSIVRSLANRWMWLTPIWTERLEWRVSIKCNFYKKVNNHSTSKYEYQSLNHFTKGQKVKFVAEVGNIEWPFEVKWQVVNSWDEVWENNRRWDFHNGMNEDFVEIENSLINWEMVSYQWIHWVQCFIIKNWYIVGKSEKFYVVVD